MQVWRGGIKARFNAQWAIFSEFFNQFRFEQNFMCTA
jgi:hypothetical protein